MERVTEIQRNKHLNIKVFNIKLISNNRKGEEAYIDIFNKLHARKTTVNTMSDKYAKLRTQSWAYEKNILTGMLVYFTQLNDKGWYNDKTNKIEEHDTDDHLHPNGKECQYYFIPKIHRFCFIDDNKVSVTNVFKFLSKGLAEVIEEDEEIQVFIEQSNDGIDKIFNAASISRIVLQASFTNNDLTDDFEKLMDDDLRNSNISELNMNVKSTKAKSIDLEHSKIISGGIKLAQSNGFVEATIIDSKTLKKETIKTRNYHLRLKIESKPGHEAKTIFDKLLSIFKRN